MLNVSLFLGFFDPLYEKVLGEINPQTRALYISNREDSYLNEIVVEGTSYFGKYLDEIVCISDLELLEKNIYSILYKIIPGHTHENIPLEILIIPSASD